MQRNQHSRRSYQSHKNTRRNYSRSRSRNNTSNRLNHIKLLAYSAEAQRAMRDNDSVQQLRLIQQGKYYHRNKENIDQSVQSLSIDVNMPSNRKSAQHQSPQHKSSQHKSPQHKSPQHKSPTPQTPPKNNRKSLTSKSPSNRLSPNHKSPASTAGLIVHESSNEPNKNNDKHEMSYSDNDDDMDLDDNDKSPTSKPNDNMYLDDQDKSPTPKPEPTKGFIKIKDRSLYLELKNKNKFSENSDNKELSDVFHIVVSQTNTRGLKVDNKKYDIKYIKKQLLLNEFTLTSIGRGSSPCWKYYHCIINEKGELIDKYAFCHGCNKVHYKGTSSSNLTGHIKVHQSDDGNTNTHGNNTNNNSTNNAKYQSNKPAVNLKPNVIDQLRLNSTYFINGSYSSFELISGQEYINHIQDYVDAAAQYGRFDVSALDITPYKIKQTTKSEAHSIRQAQIEIIKQICEDNVLPPMSFCADLYGDAHLQRANIGLDLFVIIDWKLKEIPLGVIPVEGIIEYLSKNGGENIETDFDEEDFLNDGDSDFPGGYKTFVINDANGNEEVIKIPSKNWMNIQDQLARLIKMFGISNRAAEIFPFVFTTDKGGNIRLALENWLLFLGIICLAHRLSTVFKTALRKSKEQNAAFNKWWHGMCSLIGIINKSEWRSKMNPSVKPPVPTRFWSNHTMVESFEPNFDKVKKYAQNNGHSDKINFRKKSVTSMKNVLFYGKSIIQQTESRTEPTIQLCLPSVQRLYTDILKNNGNDSSYSKLFKKNSKIQIENKIFQDIKEVHLMACYLNPMTRDNVYKFAGVSNDTWNGKQRRKDMLRSLVVKYKRLKILCKKEGHLAPSNKKRGRPKKKRGDNEQYFDIYEFGGSSNENTNYNSAADDGDDDEDDEDDEEKYINDHTKIPKEIQKFNALDIDEIAKKYGKKTINKNPLIFYKYNHHIFWILSMIAKHIYSIAVTSVGSEALFNGSGMTRTKQRATLGQNLACDVHTMQKWLETGRND